MRQEYIKLNKYHIFPTAATAVVMVDTEDMPSLLEDTPRFTLRPTDLGDMDTVDTVVDTVDTAVDTVDMAVDTVDMAVDTVDTAVDILTVTVPMLETVDMAVAMATKTLC